MPRMEPVTAGWEASMLSPYWEIDALPVVVSLLVEWSVPTPEVFSSNPHIDQILSTITLLKVTRLKWRKRGQEMPNLKSQMAEGEKNEVFQSCKFERNHPTVAVFHLVSSCPKFLRPAWGRGWRRRRRRRRQRKSGMVRSRSGPSQQVVEERSGQGQESQVSLFHLQPFLTQLLVRSSSSVVGDTILMLIQACQCRKLFKVSAQRTHLVRSGWV